jgi:hypothetical protein
LDAELRPASREVQPVAAARQASRDEAERPGHPAEEQQPAAQPGAGVPALPAALQRQVAAPAGEAVVAERPEPAAGEEPRQRGPPEHLVDVAA